MSAECKIPTVSLKESKVACRIGEWLFTEMELGWSHFPLSVNLLLRLSLCICKV